MKIEIDLKDILGDEFGDTESLAESIRRQVVDSLKAEMAKGIKSKIDEEIASIMQKRIAVEIDLVMPRFIREVLDAEYTPVEKYGSRQPPTTFRQEMVKEITKQMVFSEDRYGSSQNHFTKAVNSILEVKTKEFQKEFNKVVDNEFTKKTVELVTTELRKKFNL